MTKVKVMRTTPIAASLKREVQRQVRADQVMVAMMAVRRRMMRDDENEEVYDKRDSIMKMNVAKTTTSDDNYFG